MQEDTSQTTNSDIRLKVSLVQANLLWHEVDENINHMGKLVSGIEDTDLIVLPEMWSSGFTMMAHRYHHQTERAVSIMQNWAKDKSAVVCGSLITKAGEFYYNRLYCVSASGVIATYDKKHLFGFAGEDRSFTAGKEKVDVNIGGFKVRLNICYDLRFPVWSRNDTDYDVLIYTANWPDKRVAAWKTLLQARAMENQCYVLGTNCVGEDLWNNTYAGYSSIYAPDGELLIQGKEEAIMSQTLHLENVTTYREAFPILKDRDAFTLVD